LRNIIDPISLQDIDDCNEWLVGMMGANIENNIVQDDELVLDGDTLTWGDVARATGAGEPRTNTRQQTKLRSIGASSARTTHKKGLSSSFKQVQYGLKDEDLDYNHEMEDIEDLSEGQESMDEDVFED
jgi:hypothetical protein